MSAFSCLPDQLLSPQFTFHVGEFGTPVSVHAAVMANLSHPFDRMINGDMKEAQDKCAKLKHVEKEVFLRLVEFAYTGDYTMRPCANDSIQGARKDRAEMEEHSTLWEDARVIIDHANYGHEPDFGEISLEAHWSFRRYLPQPTPTKPDAPSKLSGEAIHVDDRDHRPAFLAHAKLYSLADQYIIPGLKDLTLQKMHDVLRLCQLSTCLHREGRVRDFVELVAYVYSNENTPDREPGGRTDYMRNEILEFAVLHMQQLSGVASFEKAHGERGSACCRHGQSVREVASCREARIKQTEHNGVLHIVIQETRPLWAPFAAAQSQGENWMGASIYRSFLGGPCSYRHRPQA